MFNFDQIHAVKAAEWHPQWWGGNYGQRKKQKTQRIHAIRGALPGNGDHSKGSRVSLHSTGNRGRMAETGRCYSSFIETQDIVQMKQTASVGGVSRF
jgi:hypothetical protein